MRLKSIKLVGFKSFADPTEIDFPSNMCGIVGPNGCGKSNVIDAVRWVMGESSAKHLRGESMTDVIFKGAKERKPSGFASVELIFDNTDNRISGEYAAYNEISVKRRLSTDAKNTYFLNSSRCRRRDIMDVFLGTGLGPRSYSIISQGIISSLIESKPEELRIFIEEAAGISKYKERRRETENRIHRTQENLDRLSDLREELDRQIKRLSGQAKAAEKYKEYKSAERLKKTELSALRWNCYMDKIQSYEACINKLELALEAANSKIQSCETSIEEARVKKIDQTDYFNKVQDSYYKVGNEVTRLQEALRHREEKLRQLTTDLEHTEKVWKEIKEQMIVDQEKIKELELRRLELEPEMEIIQAKDQESQEILMQVEEELQQRQEEWEIVNARHQKAQRVTEVQNSRIEHAEQVQIRLQERIDRLQNDLKVLSDNEDDKQCEILSGQLTEIEIQQESIKECMGSCLQSIEISRADIREKEKNLDICKTKLVKAEGKKASLEILLRAVDNQDDSIKEWLDKAGLIANARLMEKVRVEPGWEVALEMVLVGRLQAICVETMDAINISVDQLQEGSLIFALSDKKVPDSLELFQDFELLVNKVHTGREYVGDIFGIYCVSSLEEALQYRSSLTDHQSLITKDGCWVARNWLKVERGYTKESSVLARQQEQDQLSMDIEGLQKEHDNIQPNLNETRLQLEQQEKMREELQKQLGEIGSRYGDVRSDLKSITTRLEHISERRHHLECEQTESQKQYEQEADVIKEARQLLQESLDVMAEDSQHCQHLRGQRDLYQSQLVELKKRVQSEKERSHKLDLEYQLVSSGIEASGAAIFRLGQQGSQLRERREDLRESLSVLQRPETESEEQLEALLQKRLETEYRMQEARKTLEEIELKLREQEKLSQNDRKKAESYRNELEAVRMDWQGIDVRRKTLEEELKEKQSDPLELLKGLEEGATEAAWESDIRELQVLIEKQGAVNLAAGEEYETQVGRKEHLDAQNKDLTSALSTLQNAISRIDEETKQRFKVTFDKVNSGLQILFPKVFGGGKSYLELIGDDLLDSGVAIMAQPPGKKNSTVHLLSGGEKALTAIALVFSIFQLNPSPFCMLDEVDAPLDDANVGRYIEMVKQMSEKVQFIYISHNKLAMQSARQLIGVTMHELGVSRPVTVDIDEAEKIAEI